MITLALISRHLKKVSLDRFHRILDLYGYGATDANILEFLRMPIDHPGRFNNVVLVTSKWRQASSLQNIFCALNQVYDIPEVKEALGESYDAIVKATKNFVRAAISSIAMPPPIIEDREDREDSDDGDDGEEVENHNYGEGVEEDGDDAGEFIARLKMYCMELQRLESEAAQAIGRMIMYDINMIMK